MADTENFSSESKAAPPSGSTYIQRQLSVSFPDSYVYSNVTGLASSLMDIHISFAEASADGKDITTRVGVVMSPESAAQLALNLIKQLVVYEQAFGSIRYPEWVSFAKSGAVSTNPSPEATAE